MDQISMSFEEIQNENKTISATEMTREESKEPKDLSCPLTVSQKGVYLQCVANPDSLSHNVPNLFFLPKGTDAKRFILAAKLVFENHTVFQVKIGAPKGIPSMIYTPFDVVITEKNVEDIEEAKKDFIVPFDIENGPLFRAELWYCPEELIFAIDIHHIIFDGVSLNVLIHQIAQVYDGEALQMSKTTIFDVAAEETAYKTGDAYLKDQLYFKDKFEEVDCDSLPVPDQVVDDDTLFGINRVSRSLDKKYYNSNAIGRFVKEKEISENALFLGAFAYTLAKYNGASESAFSTLHHGRKNAELASAIGMFVKTLPMHYAFDKDMRVDGFLQTVYDDYYELRKHDDMPLEKLVAAYNINTDVMFIFESALFDDIPMGDGTIRSKLINEINSPSKLDFTVTKKGPGYDIWVHYDIADYTKAYVNGFIDLYCNVLTGFLKAETLGDIELISPKNLEVLERFNQTERYYDTETTIVELFRKQVKKTPDSICLVYKDHRYSYAQVDALTECLAQYLVEMGVGKEKVVGVLIPRNEYMLICALGILKAGGAYLPLDPAYPAERLNLMIQDSGAMMLINSEEYDDVIDGSFKGYRLDTAVIPHLKPQNIILNTPSPEDLFVLLYTSETTGTSKGVMCEHANAMVTVMWERRYYHINKFSKVSVCSGDGFDTHLYDMYPPIISGAELHIIPDELCFDFPALKDYFNQNKITHTVMTSQAGTQFAEIKGLTTLRHLTVAGEEYAPLNVPQEFTYYHVYGSPEGSAVTGAFKTEKRYKDVPIGVPVDNLKCYVVDPDGKRLPAGAVGELWIAGPHVTRGYLNRQDKTEEAYGENPFISNEEDDTVPHKQERFDMDLFNSNNNRFGNFKQSYQRVYKTGDIVRLMHDGNIQFIGRGDARVKIKKFSVELTESEDSGLMENQAENRGLYVESDEIEKAIIGDKTAIQSEVSVRDNDHSESDDHYTGDCTTLESSEQCTEALDQATNPASYTYNAPVQENIAYPALKYNHSKYASTVKREELGNVLLTGAVGFLGIHVLRELIDSESGHIWCLVRKGQHKDAVSRLKTMLFYYFSTSFAEMFDERITVIDADITSDALWDALKDLPFDTVINCAACVKHFSETDVLEKINVCGVENLIDICMKKNARMIQISTVSVPGIHTAESYEQQMRMHENELFVIDDADNKYVISKYHAELKMLDAIEKGLRGKILRVGNMTGRYSDGEFQGNTETNMFMRDIRGFAIMGKYPISHMTEPMRFSPVDCTAKAIVLLAGTNDEFTAFHVDNRYGFDEMKVIDACNRNGIPIYPETDDKYFEEFRQKSADDKANEGLNGLAVYDIEGVHAVETDNLFTANVLYRLGFSWPLPDETYLDRTIRGLRMSDFFNTDYSDNV